MALKPCQGCQQLVDTTAITCPRCGRADPAKVKPQVSVSRPIVMVIVGIPLAIIGMKMCSPSRTKTGEASTTPPPPKATPSPHWKGPAAWVKTLQAVLEKGKSPKPFDSFRQDGILHATYKLDSPVPDSAASLERIVGKPAAWRWTVMSKAIALYDVAPPSQMERLFAETSRMTWYQVNGGFFKDDYLGHMPPKSAGEEGMLILQTPLYTHERNNNGLMPWLCSHGRVGGAASLSSEGMADKCRELVREMLKAPSSAKFSYEDDDLPAYYGNCDMEWKSWVEAKNAFGVPLRNTFACTFNARTGRIQARFR